MSARSVQLPRHSSDRDAPKSSRHRTPSRRIVATPFASGFMRPSLSLAVLAGSLLTATVACDDDTASPSTSTVAPTPAPTDAPPDDATDIMSVPEFSDLEPGTYVVDPDGDAAT